MREADAVIILCNKKCLSPDEEDAANITRYSYFLKPYKFPENILLETNVFFVLVQAKYFKHRESIEICAQDISLVKRKFCHLPVRWYHDNVPFTQSYIFIHIYYSER